jgi:hypothetical protein
VPDGLPIADIQAARPKSTKLSDSRAVLRVSNQFCFAVISAYRKVIESRKRADRKTSSYGLPPNLRRRTAYESATVSSILFANWLVNL